MKSVAIIGTGPAGLMAASILSAANCSVTLFEKRKSPGRKFLVAGSSGLNITNSLPQAEFIQKYTGPKGLWKKIISEFNPEDWIEHIHSLNEETFLGTSGRYFVRSMKASKLLRAWIHQLSACGVSFQYHHEWSGLSYASDGQVRLEFVGKNSENFDSVILALGGGSWERDEKPLRWTELIRKLGIEFKEFSSSNCGYHVDWPSDFLKESEGLPLKNIELTTSQGKMRGDCVVTRYGLEGTPIYTLGISGQAYLNLKPDLTANQMLQKCNALKENLSPLRRVQKKLNLSESAQSLLFHSLSGVEKQDLNALISKIVKFPIIIGQSRPLEEAISSRGGVSFSEVGEDLQLKKYPSVYVAGEMLDWDAPTGGFLIQAAVSMGAFVARQIIHSDQKG